jgi:hypothetical protein
MVGASRGAESPLDRRRAASGASAALADRGAVDLRRRYLRQTIWPIALQHVVSGLVGGGRRRSARQRAVGAAAGAAERPPARQLRATPFTRSCSPRRCRSCCSRRVDGQLTRAKQEADGGAGCTKRSARLNQHIERLRRRSRARGAVAGRGARRPATIAGGPAAARRTATTKSTRASSRSSSPIAPAWCSEIFPPRDSESPPISDREYFIDAVQSRRMAISDVILGRLSHVPIVTIAVPIVECGTRSPASPAARSTCRSSSVRRRLPDAADAQITVSISTRA